MSITADTNITIGLVLAVVALVLALIRAWNTEKKELHKLIAQERQWREEADTTLRNALERIANDATSRYTLIFQEFLKNQKEVAETYITKEDVERSEGRTALALEKLLNRVDSLGIELAKSNRVSK